MPVQYQIHGRGAVEIAASVEAGIRAGSLASGATLPPVRALASDLQVSPATVAAAYLALRQRGVVETAGRLGTRVRPRPPVASMRTSRLLPVPSGMRNLSTGEPDPRLLPDLRRHLRALAASRQPATGYAQAGPLPELIELARQRFARDGVGVRGAAITVAGGALDGIERLLVTQLRPGDRVGVEDPGWANLLDLVAALGLEPVPVAGDQQGPDPDAVTAALRTGIRALVVTTRAQNPTGAALSRARSQALRDRLAAAPELLVIEDDHAAELSGVALHALAGATTHWAVVRSASKPYGPDLRMAVVAGDEATLARVAGRMRLGSGWVSTVLQRLLVHLWRDAAVADQIAAARDSYDQRRNGLLAELVARGLPATGRTGINVWVPVADETLAITRLREAGYAVAPGSLYRIGAPPGIRITVSPLDPPQIVPLADAVAAAVSLDSGRTRQDR